MNEITKSGIITICGRPNVGKSTLTNALVGEKIAIVSNKPQTTRNRICAVLTRGDSQFVFMDTPGLHKPKSALGDYMVKVVTASLSDVDCALLLVEPIAHVGAPELALIERVKEEGIPAILCINKIDTVEPAELLPVIAAYNEVWDGFDAIIPTMLSTLPAIIIAIVIVLVLSASMSTLSSLVLTSSSTVTLDFIAPLCEKKKPLNEKKQMLCIRIFIAVFIIIFHQKKISGKAH